jgi:septal ring factor EnvC (AmiA/AmiB activator)
MSRTSKALVVAIVAGFGLWGCAKGTGGADRTQVLEKKVAQLEEDFRAAAVARDQVRQKLTAAEEHGARLEHEVAQLRLVVKERDELRRQLTTRTGERDTLQVQYDQFRRSLRDLLGQAEAAAPALGATAPALGAGLPTPPAAPGAGLPTPPAVTTATAGRSTDNS